MKKNTIFTILALLSLVGVAQGMHFPDSSSLEEKPFDCLVCFDTLPVEDLSVLDCCKNNKICLSCRIESIDMQLTNKEIPHCSNVGCPQIISDKEMFRIVNHDDALRKKYYSFLEQRWKQEAGILPCPTRNCEAEFESKSGMIEHHCFSCKQSYCPTCRFNHKGITCEAAGFLSHDCTLCGTNHERNMDCEQAEQERKDGTTEKKEKRRLVQKNRQKCPKCLIMLEKETGCNHMTCGQCHHQFCWLCLKSWIPRLCGCDQFGVDAAQIAQQLTEIEKNVTTARGYEKTRLEQEKNRLENELIDMENRKAPEEEKIKERIADDERKAKEQVEIDKRNAKIQAELEAKKNVIIATSISGIAGTYLACSSVYQAWSQRRIARNIVQTAEQLVEKILAIEFEFFDEHNGFLTLQEQFNIDLFAKQIKDDEKRSALVTAIEAYDTTIKKVYDTISLPKYYYQSSEYFAKSEPELVKALYADLDTLKQVMTTCQADIVADQKRLLGAAGLLSCAGIGLAYILS